MLVLVVAFATVVVVIVWKRAVVKNRRGYLLIDGKEEAAKPINYGATEECTKSLANPVSPIRSGKLPSIVLGSTVVM